MSYHESERTSADGAAPRHAELIGDLVAQVSDHAIVALDLQGTIVSWNAGAEAVKGYTAEEAIGRSFTMFYDDADRRRGLPGHLLREAGRAGNVQHSGWRVRKDGTRFWADVTITALRDAEGRPTGFAKVTRDLTEQHAVETRLVESEERLRLLVGQVVDYAIIALDPQGTIETWNLGAQRLKGYDAAEAVGRSFAMFYTAEDQRAGLPSRLLEAARNRGRVEHTGWRVRQDGTRFWADVTITALRNADGELNGYAKVTRDRTEVKRLEEAQDAFYAAFAHDFRTPVTVIKGFLEELRDAEEGDRELLLDRIETSSDRLLSMVEGLLDFARQRVDHVDLRLDDIDVAQVARVAVADLARQLPGRELVVEDVVALATANGDAMHRIVTNLLLNAAKYSAADTRVEVRFETRDDVVEMRVVDRGRGIHPDDLPLIFEQFERGRMSTVDGGSGLGLASTRDLVVLQDGGVSIASEVGVGTTVTVRLPSAGLGSAPAGGGQGRSALAPEGCGSSEGGSSEGGSSGRGHCGP